MSVVTLVTLTAILFGFALILLRSTARPRRWIAVLGGLPGAILLCRWAAYRQAWPEAAISFLACLILLGVWWRIWGRRLPPPHSGDIRVWSKEDPF